MKKSFAIIGLGRFGLSLIEELSKYTNDIIGIDTDMDAVKTASHIIEQAYQADSSSEKALRSIGVQNADHAVISFGENFEGTIMTYVTLKNLGIKDITVRCDKDNYVEVELSAGDKITTKFNKKEVDELFEVKILGVNPLKSYDNITIKITLNPNTSISLGGIQLIRKESGLLYSYDENGNRISSSFGNKTNNIQYENNMPSLSIGVDSSMCRYKYDNNHNLIETKTGYGVKIENKYSTTYKNNLISTEISNASKTRTIKTRKEYSSDGRFVVKEIDEQLKQDFQWKISDEEKLYLIVHIQRIYEKSSKY